MERTTPPSFNEDEIELIKLICEDYTIIEIAYILQVNKWTIVEQCKQLIEKTNSKNIVGIAKYALLTGIYKL